MQLEDLKSYELLKAEDPILAGQVKTVCDWVTPILNGISGHYGNYTMHDINHGLRVAKYMEDLAFGIDENANERALQFNALELALMILSAILHDIGMFVRPCDEVDIKANRIKYTNALTFEGVMAVLKDENEAIKEIVRRTHAARIEDFLYFVFDGHKISDELSIKNNYSFAEDIITICKAHGEDYSFLESMREQTTKGNYVYNLRYFAALLRIADCLDLDKQRAPMLWFSAMEISGYSKGEWEKHFIIQNERKLKDYMDGKMQIYFDGISRDAKIHRKYLRHIDELKVELENADALLNTKTAEKKYKFNVSTKIADCVRTEGFEYSDLRLNLDYSAITELLMGKNIYGDSKLGLRELIQNSIDACKIMKEVKDKPALSLPPSICIRYSKNENYVKVCDTGTGMTMDVVKNHFLNVGKSYYKSSEYLYHAFSYKPIGQYGIGFLACFLLSDNVTVNTKYYKSNEVLQIELEKNSEYVVTKIEETPMFCGTEIRLDYDKFFAVFKSIEQLKSFIETYFYTEIPIYIRDMDNDEEDVRVLNKCDDKILSALKASEKRGYEELNCKNYSELIKGKMYLMPAKKSVDNNIVVIEKEKIFIFDVNINKFVNASSIPEGYYSCVKYAMISEGDYGALIKNKSSRTKRREEIYALAKKKDQLCYIFIKDGDTFPFVYDYDDEEESEKIKTIMVDSGLNYFPEMFISRNQTNVFATEKSFIYLQPSVLNDDFGIYYMPTSFSDVPTFFYYKDIRVRDFRLIRGLIPSIPYSACGYLNYIGNDIKLDVSRNEIIYGYDKIRQEYTNIILKYCIDNEKTSSDIRAFCEKMLDYNINKKSTDNGN